MNDTVEVLKNKSYSDFEWLINLENNNLIKLNFPAKIYADKALIDFEMECEKEDLMRNSDCLKDRHKEYDNLEQKIKKNRETLNKLNSRLNKLKEVL